MSISKVNTESGEIKFIYTVYYRRRNGHATALVDDIKNDLNITLTAKVALKNKASNALFTKSAHCSRVMTNIIITTYERR